MKKYILSIIMFFVFCGIAQAYDNPQAVLAQGQAHGKQELLLLISEQQRYYMGQKVWDILEGRGTIEKIGVPRDLGMAIKVKMDNGEYRWYSLDGKYASSKEVRRLYSVETKSINFTLDKLFPEQKNPQRLTVNEMIGTETFHTIWYGETKYYCVRCGKSLKFNPSGHYCPSCKTGWGIKEE